MTPADATLQVAANQRIAQSTYLLKLCGEVEPMTPGQFVNLEVPGFYLRRPLSVYQVGPGQLDLIYKVLGEGTQALAGVGVGTNLNVLMGLGNGFDIKASRQRPLIVGGGVGVVPMLYLAQALLKADKKPGAILGFNSEPEIFLAAEMESLGIPVALTTADGTKGTKGFVTAALDRFPQADYFYACGPTPMLKALTAATDLPGQISLEERMACGFGACVGCATPTEHGKKRVCKDGPIFTRKELQW